MLQDYRKHVEERAAQGIPPKPLSAEQTSQLVKLLESPPAGEADFLLDLFMNRVPAGVDDAAYVKAGFLAAIAKGEAKCGLISREKAVEILGTMLGGYNIEPLVVPPRSTPSSRPVAADAAQEDAAHVRRLPRRRRASAKAGNEHAKAVVQSWADAEWFTSRPKVAEKITLTVFKVTGETNTDDLSPAQDAWSRPDIPLHALAMLKNAREGIHNALEQIKEVQKKGHPVAYVGDVVGTGSSRKSATNSVLWHFGDDIPFIPNKRSGGVCIGGKIAPIFFNTMEDSGALPIECDVTKLAMGDVIVIYPYEGKVTNEAGETLSTFSLKTEVILDEVQAGGRIPLIIGRSLTEARARISLGLEPLGRVPQARRRSARHRQGLHARAEDGRPRVRRGGHPPRHLLRARTWRPSARRTPPAR
jgi:aconitate hydratase 2/2-methylisocitrate dehydratase